MVKARYRHPPSIRTLHPFIFPLSMNSNYPIVFLFSFSDNYCPIGKKTPPDKRCRKNVGRGRSRKSSGCSSTRTVRLSICLSVYLYIIVLTREMNSRRYGTAHLPHDTLTLPLSLCPLHPWTGTGLIISLQYLSG